VTTLAKFIEPLTPWTAVPEPVLHLVIGQALARLKPAQFAAVEGFRGFHHALATLIEEASIDALSGPFAEDLKKLFEHVHSNLAGRGMAVRNERLRSCPRLLPDGTHVIFDGFFSFSAAELDFLARLTPHVQTTVTLPHTS